MPRLLSSIWTAGMPLINRMTPNLHNFMVARHGSSRFNIDGSKHVAVEVCDSPDRRPIQFRFSSSAVNASEPVEVPSVHRSVNTPALGLSRVKSPKVTASLAAFPTEKFPDHLPKTMLLRHPCERAHRTAPAGVATSGPVGAGSFLRRAVLDR